jgi:hypothetical protein
MLACCLLDVCFSLPPPSSSDLLLLLSASSSFFSLCRCIWHPSSSRLNLYLNYARVGVLPVFPTKPHQHHIVLMCSQIVQNSRLEFGKRWPRSSAFCFTFLIDVVGAGAGAGGGKLGYSGSVSDKFKQDT